MLEYDRTDISEGTDINKTNASKEYDICHYWYFLRENFNYEPYLCKTFVIVSVKGNDYRIHLRYMSKDDAMNIMNNSNLSEKRAVL